MNKYNYGYGTDEKKVNPLKIIGIIALILVIVGIVIYAKDYQHYYEHFKDFNNHTVEEGN